MNTAFTPITRESTLSSRVIRQMEGMITEHLLRPGDRLPSERELCKQFEVSRTVIREAVSALAAKSLLEIQPGGGAVVRTPSRESVAQSMALFLRAGRPELEYGQVNEIRRLLEVEIAGLAAERRTEQDLSELERILEEAHHGISDQERFALSDVAFHSALARATHNDLFNLILSSLSDVLLGVRYTGFMIPGTPERALHHHKHIAEQIRLGDAEKARDAMRSHLAEAAETQRQANEGNF